MAEVRPVGGVPAGPLTDAGATSYHAVRRVLAHLHEDGTAVVFGVGGLGAFVVQILRAVSPARVVAVDPSPLRRALASELGAHQVLDGVDDRTGECLRAVLGGQGADAVIDLVGTDETITAGGRCARRRWCVGGGGCRRRDAAPFLVRGPAP